MFLFFFLLGFIDFLIFFFFNVLEEVDSFFIRIISCCFILEVELIFLVFVFVRGSVVKVMSFLCIIIDYLDI